MVCTSIVLPFLKAKKEWKKNKINGLTLNSYSWYEEKSNILYWKTFLIRLFFFHERKKMFFETSIFFNSLKMNCFYIVSVSEIADTQKTSKKCHHCNLSREFEHHLQDLFGLPCCGLAFHQNLFFFNLHQVMVQLVCAITPETLTRWTRAIKPSDKVNLWSAVKVHFSWILTFDLKVKMWHIYRLGKSDFASQLNTVILSNEDTRNTFKI